MKKVFEIAGGKLWKTAGATFGEAEQGLQIFGDVSGHFFFRTFCFNFRLEFINFRRYFVLQRCHPSIASHNQKKSSVQRREGWHQIIITIIKRKKKEGTTDGDRLKSRSPMTITNDNQNLCYFTETPNRNNFVSPLDLRHPWPPFQESLGPFGPECPRECLTECPRKSGCPTECPGGFPQGPSGPAPRSVQKVSRECAPECQKGVPHTPGTHSGHFLDTPGHGARRAFGTPPRTLRRIIGDTPSDTPGDTRPERLL